MKLLRAKTATKMLSKSPKEEKKARQSLNYYCTCDTLFVRVAAHAAFWNEPSIPVEFAA